MMRRCPGSTRRVGPGYRPSPVVEPSDDDPFCRAYAYTNAFVTGFATVSRVIVDWCARSVTSSTPSLLESRTGSRNGARPVVVVFVAGFEVGVGDELSDEHA